MYLHAYLGSRKTLNGPALTDISFRMEMNALKSQVEGMEAKYPSLGFQYTDPGRGFDRRKGGVLELSSS